MFISSTELYCDDLEPIILKYTHRRIGRSEDFEFTKY